MDKFYNALLQVKDVALDDGVVADSRVVEALEDDLNTPLALSYIHDLVNQLNKAETNEDKVITIKQALKDSRLNKRLKSL